MAGTLAPAVGFIIVVYVIFNAEPTAQIASSAWPAAGVIVL